MSARVALGPWLVSLGLVAVLSSPSRAAPAPAPDARKVAADASRKAKAHWLKAEEYYQRYKFKEALQEYKKAMRYKQDAAFLYNIAQCYRFLKSYKKALFYYKLYLVDAPNAPNQAAVVAAVKEMKKKIAAQTSAATRVTLSSVSINTSPSGAEVLLDNKRMGKSPITLQVKPGTHLIVAVLRGHQEARRTLVVKQGRDLAVDLALKSDRVVDSKAVPKDRYSLKTVWRHKWLFWTGLAVTVGVAVTAVGLGLLTARRHNDYQNMADNDPDLASVRKEGRTLAMTTDALIGVAAAVAIGTIVAFILTRKKERVRATTLVLPSCGPAGCGVSVLGRF